MKQYNIENNPSHYKCQIKNLGEIYNEYLGFKKDGSFVEVGAFDGLSWSNTFGLAVAGWKGLFFEPQPDYFDMCKNNYKDFSKIKVINSCVGNYTGDIKLYTAHSLSTTDLETFKDHNKLNFNKENNKLGWDKGYFSEDKSIVSKIDTLDNFLENENFEKDFDVLVIDVEGTEYEVLKGFTISKWRPKMIIIELDENKYLQKILNYFDDNHYKKVYSDEINSIFVINNLIKLF